MQVSRSRQLGAIVVLAAMATGGFWLGRYLHSKGLAWAANFSSVAAAVLAAVTLLLPVFFRLMRTLSGPPPLSRASIPQTRDDLAVVLAREWAQEEQLRRINDPRPLPVRWEVTPTARRATATAANVATADEAGQFGTILSLFSRLSPSRLIILGRAGAGKSVLVIKLARDLLDARQADMPVPVILPAAAWDLDVGLPEWIADQLCRNHPALAQRVKDATGKITTLAFALAIDKMVLPIIDGLDELSEEQRSRAIDMINKFGSDAPLVLTSRPEEFLAAVASTGRGLARAVVIEVLPLEVRQAEQYLIEATAVTPAGRWDGVFARLNSEPDGPLARVLCTPLMLWLARTVYESAGDPAELADQGRFSDIEELERHLLDAFVPTVYGEITGSRRPRYRSRQAQHWLGFLAAYLNRTSQPDFAWWRLIRATPGWQVTCSGLSSVLTYSALWAVTDWVLTRHGHWDKSTYISHAAWHSILMGGPLGKQAWPAVDRLLAFRDQRLSHAMHEFITGGHHNPIPFLPWISFPAFEIVLAVSGIVYGLLFFAVGMNVSPRRLRVRPLSVVGTAVRRTLIRAFFVFFLVSLAFVLLRPASTSPVFPAGFFQQEPTWRALIAVAVTGATVISLSSVATPLDISRSSSPADALRLDRQASWSIWAFRSVLGIAIAWLWAGPEIATAYGSFAVIVTIIRVVLGGLGGPFWAAQGYGEAHTWLFVRGKIPWRTLRFLADAHRRGVLRQTGAVYQFRHIRLQERLAAQQSLMITHAVGRWRVREVLGLLRMRIFTISGQAQLRAIHEEKARHYGWVFTIGPRGKHTYRDRRFDRLTRLTGHDNASIDDEQAP